MSLRCGGEGQPVADLGAEMLEKSREDGEAADDDPDRELGVSPSTKEDDVVAEICVFGDYPSVVGSNDGGYASARSLTVSEVSSVIGGRNLTT